MQAQKHEIYASRIMAVLETPWFMKTKTSDLRKFNQVFEERLQKQVTILEIKQKRSLLKIDEQINILRRDLRRIRSEVNFATDLDEHGNKVDPDATRSKSTGDLAPRRNLGTRPLTKSALFRHNKFVQAMTVKKKVTADSPTIQMLRDKYGEGSEVRKLQAQLQQKVMPPIGVVQRKKKTKKRFCQHLPVLSTIKNSDKDDDDVFLKGNSELIVTKINLPKKSTDTARDRDRRFSISTSRKRTHDQLPSVNGVEQKLTKADQSKFNEI